jgi:omega-amidase
MDNNQLHLSLLQFPLVWESPEQNILFFETQIRALSLSKTKPDIIILPEMWSTGFSMKLKDTAALMGQLSLSFMIQIAKETQMAIVGSTIFKEGAHSFNRLFFVYPEGHYECYDKRHTFGMAGESEVYNKGDKHLIVHYKGFRICPLICYDLRFPIWARNTNAYDVLLYVANWPAPRIHAWDSLLKARAIENMSYCIGVNRVGTDPNGHLYPGHSAVYNPFGDPLCFSDKEETIPISLDLERLKKARLDFPFLEDMDEFTILIGKD